MSNISYHDNTVELVITPPEPYGSWLAHHFQIRMTIGVIIQLIAQAQNHILIASPFFESWEHQKMNVLRDALKHALNRNVHLDIISTGSSIEIIRKSLSNLRGKGTCNLYRPKPNIEDAKLLGSHAKVLVVDSQHAYIGSANLTSPGLMGNLEMGVLLHGKTAAQVSAFWKYLIEGEFLSQETLLRIS